MAQHGAGAFQGSMLVSPAERTHACTLPISPILLNASTCSYVWTGYQKNLDALATFDDVCAYGDSTQPQCAAAQALAPFRYIVSSTTAVRYWQAGWLLHCRHTLSALA